MPKGIYKRVKIRHWKWKVKNRKGNVTSFQKGHITWNKGKKLGFKPIGMKGKKHSEELKKQTSERMTQLWKNSDHKSNISTKVSKALRGHFVSEKTKQKQREAKNKYYENHHAWNFQGNKDWENERIRCSLEYVIWRSEIYKRDNWTCRLCEKHCEKGNIIAHHIKLFSGFPELRFSIDNGITLCRKCHLKIHNGGKLKLVGAGN